MFSQDAMSQWKRDLGVTSQMATVVTVGGAGNVQQRKQSEKGAFSKLKLTIIAEVVTNDTPVGQSLPVTDAMDQDSRTAVDIRVSVARAI